MTTLKLTTLSALLMTSAHAATAQPARPGDSTRAVTLSLVEYNRLIDLANRPPQGPAIAPVASVLAGADLRVRVERETVRGTFSLTGEVLRAGVNRVSLLSGATLVEASAAGRPLPLMAEGAAHTALLPGPGPFSLTLEWGAALAFTPGRASFVLPVPPAATVRATIDLPGDQADVHLSAGLVTSRSIVAGRTILEAALTPGASTDVWWSMRDSAPAAAAREVRTLADVMTLLTLGDADVRMVALVDVTVVQGQPRTIELRLPRGYELTAMSGSTLESSEIHEDTVTLTVGDPAARRHQFLIGLERPHDGGSFALETGFLTVTDVQRERGEIAVEGVGTLELTTAERDAMHRIDVRELDRSLQSLARQPILSAFRYQRAAGAAAPGLALDAKRFADAGVLAAFADSAVATTLVTSEGRALTEIRLRVQNRAQPFLKVALPAGASMVSVEVAGESAKPALGADGTRVPLLRPGFRPIAPYTVSFVYLHAGTPFARKGDMRMTLPKMDIPVGLVEWEVFVPENYSVRVIDGNVIDRQAMDVGSTSGDTKGDVSGVGVSPGVGSGLGPGSGGGAGGGIALDPNGPRGQIRGRATDPAGIPLPGVTIVLEAGSSHQTAVTGPDGSFALAGVPSGPVTLTAQLAGGGSASRALVFDQSPVRVDFALPVAAVAESIVVAAQAAPKGREAAKAAEPSQNVINLQRRASGVLPVRVDVPRAGTSHQFVRPLVVDQETVVGLRYKRR